MPAAWKRARISPLYKKGPLLSPSSYRMLAVSDVLYRLYANVLRTFVTEWSVQHTKVPHEQFGFYPQRNTTQPLFILRHLIKHSKQHQPRSSPRLYAAFMDFTQAYDKIHRPALWAHLQSIGLPPHLLTAAQAMYEGDSYVLCDGVKAAPPVQPTHGVKQGCPLSPLLFSLYINDFTTRSEHGVHLGQGGGGRVVSHMFYADDLCLFSNTPQGVRVMLRALQEYSARKGLSVNAGKSCVVVFNSQGPMREDFEYAGDPLQVQDEFKYLGATFHKSGGMSSVDAQRARAFTGAAQGVLQLAGDLGMRERVPVVLQLLQTYANSHGLYASQVWSTGFLAKSKVFESRVQQRHVSFLRSLLGVRRGTSNRALLHELGQKPFQYYWWKGVITFWNDSVGKCNSHLFRDVLRSDVALGSARCKDCWSGEVLHALRELSEADDIADLFLGRGAIEWDDVHSRLCKLYTHYWDQFSQVPTFRVPSAPERKTLTYAQCFLRDECFPPLPGYFHGTASLPLHAVRRVARFRLGSHNLGVERQRWEGVPWQDRHCKRCTPAFLSGLDLKVDDEHHALFVCEAFAHLRSAYFPECLTWDGEDWQDRSIRHFADCDEFLSLVPPLMQEVDISVVAC
jgi:hypothetical protein